MAANIYIYPNSSRGANTGLYNPYIDDLVDSLSLYFKFVNNGKPSNTGIFDILNYISNLDFVFFNWIEKLPENKAGKIQTFFLFMLIPILKLFSIKIIWTMHNKLSHSKDELFLKKLIFRKMLKNADYIITHSSEGIEFGEQLVTGSKIKIHYFPHPVKDRRSKEKPKMVHDILIWGTISPYKGIDKFLEFLFENELDKKYKIKIAGKSTSEKYFASISKFQNENIDIENCFIEDDLLRNLIAQSKLVLFTYAKSSILSSGALMDSLGYGAEIIGPDVGAFHDLDKEGILNTFSNYEELIKKVDMQLDRGFSLPNQSNLDNFLIENTWDAFSKKVAADLSIK
ncbi:MAG: glycosyltransferase [Bacteroidales bacterium]